MAPAAIITGLLSSTIVQSLGFQASSTPLSFMWAPRAGSQSNRGVSAGMRGTFPLLPSSPTTVRMGTSIISGKAEPASAESISALAFWMAPLPSEYSECRVVAAATPEGNLRRSRLMRLRFIGMAMTVPSTAKKNVQAVKIGQGRWAPSGFSGVAESISRAAMAETIVPPVA